MLGLLGAVFVIGVYYIFFLKRCFIFCCLTAIKVIGMFVPFYNGEDINACLFALLVLFRFVRNHEMEKMYVLRNN